MANQTVVNLEDHLKGDTFEGIRFELKDLDDGTPIDITGATITAQLREKSKTGKVVKTWTVGNGFTVVTEEYVDEVLTTFNNLFYLDAFEADLEPVMHYFDIEIVFPSNSYKKTYITGTLPIIQDVTNV